MKSIDKEILAIYNEVKDFVKENQGEKGYILTDRDDCDHMYALILESEYSDIWSWDERKIQAVRVIDDDLMLLAIPHVSIKTDEDVAECNDDWRSLYLDDCCYYVPTLLSIAESIEQYHK